MASSPGNPTSDAAGEDVGALGTAATLADGAAGVTPTPMHIEAQQVLPGALSCLEPVSGEPEQCSEALAGW